MVSIVMPNHNKADFILESIDSVVSQSENDWELIVVDDGSTDESLAVVQQVIDEGENRIKLVSRPKTDNGGSVCRNVGLNMAQGEYVLFLDSDDLLKDTCLKERVSYLKKNPHLDFVVYSMESFNKKPGDQSVPWIATKENSLYRFLEHDLPWQTTQPMYRRAFLLDNGLKFNESLPRLQDVMFHVDALRVPKVKFECISSTIDCYYRVDTDRIKLDYEKFFENWTFGTILFLNVCLDKVSPKEAKYLNGTVIRTYSTLYHAKVKGNLSKDGFKRLTKALFEWNGPVSGLLHGLRQIGTRVNIYVPGIRWAMCKALI